EIRSASVFPVIALMVLPVACVLSIQSFFYRKQQRLIFVSAGLYVLSGISMLIGLVVYVGSVSQSFDSKARELDSDSVYYYQFGTSFDLFVTSFVLSEFASIGAAHLYLAQIRHLNRLKALHLAQITYGGSVDEELEIEIKLEPSSNVANGVVPTEEKKKEENKTSFLSKWFAKRCQLVNTRMMKEMSIESLGQISGSRACSTNRSACSLSTASNGHLSPTQPMTNLMHYATELKAPRPDSTTYLESTTENDAPISSTYEEETDCFCGSEVMWDDAGKCFCQANHKPVDSIDGKLHTRVISDQESITTSTHKDLSSEDFPQQYRAKMTCI
ncbi:hypothetical protein Ciccas_013304, partial [Cichlidogyrus casuarinus]